MDFIWFCDGAASCGAAAPPWQVRRLPNDTAACRWASFASTAACGDRAAFRTPGLPRPRRHESTTRFFKSRLSRVLVSPTRYERLTAVLKHISLSDPRSRRCLSRDVKLRPHRYLSTSDRRRPTVSRRDTGPTLAGAGPRASTRVATRARRGRRVVLDAGTPRRSTWTPTFWSNGPCGRCSTRSAPRPGGTLARRS